MGKKGEVSHDDEPEDPMVTFVLDGCSAYYQVPEEDFYCTPPREWLDARWKSGLDINGKWRLKKQLPRRRAAAARWTDYAAKKIDDCAALPQFFRKPGTRLVVEGHMDNFHGSGKRSEVKISLGTCRS